MYASGPEIDDLDGADDVSTVSNVLLEVEVNVISNDECEQSEGTVGGWEQTYNDQITNNMICDDRDLNEDACQGDSGGPCTCASRCGVWGVGCAHKDFPGIHADADVDSTVGAEDKAGFEDGAFEGAFVGWK